MFSGFIEEKLEDCDKHHCIYDRECWRPWGLFRSGLLQPYNPAHAQPDIEVSWSSCPRHFLQARILVGGEPCAAAEWARWCIDRNVHHSDRISSRTSHLLRVYTLVKDRPARLREHIAAEKAAKR